MGVKGVCIITMEIGPHHVIKVYEETDILSQEQGQTPHEWPEEITISQSQNNYAL